MLTKHACASPSPQPGCEGLKRRQTERRLVRASQSEYFDGWKDIRNCNKSFFPKTGFHRLQNPVHGVLMSEHPSLGH